jgi:hypothetical protein
MIKENNNLRKLKTDLASLTQFEEIIEPTESDSDKVLEILLDRKDINLKTELNDKEILEIARLEVLSTKINSPSLASFLSKFKELRVSKDRQGRKEIIGAIQGNNTKSSNGFFDQFVTDLVGNKGK